MTRQRYVVCGLALLALVACREDGRNDQAEAPPPLVEAVQAREGALPIEEIVPGVVRARNQVSIRPEIEARVGEVLARSGDTVQRGQVLVRLEDDEVRERLRQAEANVRLAEAAAVAAKARVAELEARAVRSRTLAKRDLISDQELEILEAQLRAAQASADEADARVEQVQATVGERQSALAKTIVRSPVTGRLGERRAEVGMLVDNSTVLFVAGSLDELIVEVTLAEGMLATVTEGLPVLVEPRSAAGEPIRAELSRLSPFLAERSFTTVGEIDIDNDSARLRPGMFVNVRILVGESSRAVLIPVAAVWEHPSSRERGIFVVEESSGLETPSGVNREAPETSRRVSFRPVDVLAEGSGAVGVRGIEAGDWVITVGQHLLGTARTEGGASARVRPVAWEHVLALQSLQDEDLLEDFLEKQRIIAATLGAEIPASEDEVDRVLAEAAASGGSG